MQDKIEEFLKIYKEVFYDDGTVRLCGRDKTRTLIQAANALDVDDFGREDVGFMNIENINNLYKRLVDKEYKE